MRSIIRELYFDKEYISKLKREKVHLPYLRNLLSEGKITLKEYLTAQSGAKPLHKKRA